MEHVGAGADLGSGVVAVVAEGEEAYLFHGLDWAFRLVGLSLTRNTLPVKFYFDQGPRIPPAIRSDILLTVIKVLGMLDRVVDATDPYQTDVGRLRANEQLPQRVRVNYDY